MSTDPEAQLSKVATDWNAASDSGAVAAILTDGAYSAESFFATGEATVAELMEDYTGERDRALDFGCAIGRLTVALAKRFDEVYGIDASANMISKTDDNPKIDYEVLSGVTLPYADSTFSYILSLLCLQHDPTELQRCYVQEFIRVLKPGGVAVFQIPEGDDYEHPTPWLSMYGTPFEEVIGWLDGNSVDASTEHDYAGAPWVSYTYKVVKDGGNPEVEATPDNQRDPAQDAQGRGKGKARNRKSGKGNRS